MKPNGAVDGNHSGRHQFAVGRQYSSPPAKVALAHMKFMLVPVVCRVPRKGQRPAKLIVVENHIIGFGKDTVEIEAILAARNENIFI